MAAITWVESVRCVPRVLSHPSFTGRDEGIEQPLDGVMGEQALTKIVQEGEVETRVVQVQTEGIFPVDTAADRISGLAVRKPFDILHHLTSAKRQGATSTGAPRRVEIGKALIVIERTKLCPEVHIEIPFGKGRLHCSRSGLGNGGKGFRAYAHR